jgi:hypothetical protein
MATLFRQGWKAEEYFGDDVSAHHMNTRSVYRFHKDSNVSITHDAPYVGDVSTDRFTVSLLKVKSYHESGTVAHSVTTRLATFDNWLQAYYYAYEIVDSVLISLC